MTPQAFQRNTGVSDAVLHRLKIYAALLTKWQTKINLVGSSTLSALWTRHMQDSAQLATFIPPSTAHRTRVVDLGSGAGFPGLVLAIMDAGPKDGGAEYHLVESDQRKCVFLREVNRETQAGAIIHNAHSEALDPLQGDVITSRALAPLGKLLVLADKHLLSTGKGLYPKGKRWREELTEAQKDWTMTLKDHPSQTDPSGRILELAQIRKRDPRP